MLIIAAKSKEVLQISLGGFQINLFLRKDEYGLKYVIDGAKEFKVKRIPNQYPEDPRPNRRRERVVEK